MTGRVGILAYGSVISDPGKEIRSATVEIKKGVKTPFKVEFARKAGGRAEAPTLVPVDSGGGHVAAWIFVLSVEPQEAADMLYRREVNAVGSGRRYQRPENPTPNSVLIDPLYNFEQIDLVLYTKIGANINNPDADTLADLAIQSARQLKDGRDGITYLMNAIQDGIATPLSADYAKAIMQRLQAADLADALKKVS